jgi:hypothetical protein
MGIFECLVVPEESQEVAGLATAAAEEESQEVAGLAATAAAEEESQEVAGLATAAAAVPLLEKGHRHEFVPGFAGAKRGRCRGFCGKPGTAAIAPRAVRFVGNLANALDAALPIAAPRVAGFAMISPMVLGLSFVVLMV